MDNNNNIGGVIVILLFTYLLLVSGINIYSNRFDYYKSVGSPTIIVHDKILRDWSTIEVNEKEVHEGILARILFRCKYIESNCPCTVIKVDKLKPRASYKYIEECKGGWVFPDNDPLGLFVDKKAIEQEMRKRGLLPTNGENTMRVSERVKVGKYTVTRVK